MGAGQSTPLSRASDELKERVGLFSLRATQKQATEGIAFLLQHILANNNLFDLQALLSNPAACSQLVVVMSSMIKKDFRILRLPDASSRGQTHRVPFMMKKQYEELEKEPVRQAICKDIAWFVLRYCSLVSALAASITINKNTPGILQQIMALQGTSTLNKSIKDIDITPDVAQRLSVAQRISASVLENLQSQNKLQVVKVAGTETPDSRRLFYFGTTQVVINFENSTVYAPMGSRSALYMITFDLLPGPKSAAPVAPLVPEYPQYNYRPAAPAPAPAPAPPQYNYRPAAPAAAPPVAAAPAAAQGPSQVLAQAAPQVVVPQQQQQQQQQRINLFRNNTSRRNIDISSVTTAARTTSLYGGRATRKRKTRKHRMRGGNGLFYYRVKLYSTLNCMDRSCKEVENGTFVLLSNGNTMEEADYNKLIAGTNPIELQFKAFNDRVYPLLQKDEQSRLDVPREKTINSISFAPIRLANTEGYENLKRMEKAIAESVEGTSPAQYRAYLLAARIDPASAGAPAILHNMFCRDLWENRKTTDTVSYTLLQTMYNDRQDGSPESATRDEMRSTVQGAVGEKVFLDAAPTGAVAQQYDQIRFAARPAQLDPYCKKIQVSPGVQDTGERTTRNPDDIKILLEAHKQLRDLYDAHLQSVWDILKKIVIPKRGEYGQAPQFLLTPEFETDERGALVFLEEIIKDARQKIAKHYIDVEKVYYNALNKLRLRVEGESP